MQTANLSKGTVSTVFHGVLTQPRDVELLAVKNLSGRRESGSRAKQTVKTVHWLFSRLDHRAEATV